MNIRVLRSFFFSLILCLSVCGTSWSALLGVGPGYPNISFTNISKTSYDPTTRLLTVTATPTFARMLAGGSLSLVKAPASLAIAITVDNNGNLVGGVAGDDFVLTGSVAGCSGILLTGEITEFGIADASASIDYLDFRFRVTGGSMAPLFANQEIGVTQMMEVLSPYTTSFTGSFRTPFSGNAKGNLGPIPPKLVCAGEIGDFIWNDQNRNGVQDAGEPGLDNVAVTLKNSAGAVVGATVSGANGAYLFSGLCAGSYTVTVETATLPPGFLASATMQGDDTTRDGNPNDAAVTLTSGTSSDRTIDFGYNSPCSGAIGDLVWHDGNRNGMQEPGELGLNGVTVNLRHPADDSIITSTTTNGSGNYQFSGLCAGNYRVDALAPNGFVPSASLKGGNTANDSNPSPFDLTLSSDQAADRSVDFGFNTPCTGSIGDFVWNDLNRNGIQDAGEPGINGARVILKDSFSNEIATATTTGNGFYQFGGLCADSYRVEVDPASLPAGLIASVPGAGTDRGADSDGTPAAVTLATDDSADASVDFGFNTPCTGSIGDMVWMDDNRDGIQNVGEPGINGVPVTLKDAFNTTIATVKTGLGPLGQAGFYSFPGLCAGSYSVEVATPAGLEASPSQVGDSSMDSNGSPAFVVLPADDSKEPTTDFGFNPPCSGSVGNKVWDDQNRNGLQDAGEPGLDGVAVNLRDQGKVLLASTTTAAGGWYQFGGLCAGNYQVEVIPPAGRTASPALAGEDSALDSNPNPAAVTLLTDTGNDQSVDFGFNTPCTGKIGDLVWHDTNRDGIQNPPESGISGAAVTLKNSQGTVIATTNTNPAGGYLFGGLCQGNYTVEVTTPGGFVASPALQGEDRNLDSEAIPAAVTLATDASSDLAVDFAFNTPCAGSIGDLVWNDLNDDGIQGPNEPGLSGVTVLLRDLQNTLLRTTATLSDGSYRFIGLCAGDYRVEAAPPAGMIATKAAFGSDAGKDSNSNPAAVTLSDDTSADASIDFGFFTAAPALSLQKLTNGIDAPTGTGPYLPVGSTVTWSYTATNTGNVELSSVTISDDKITLSCPAVTLAVGASTTCSATGIAAAGQYQNTGTATGTYSGSTVSATYQSHYFGAAPAISVKKLTNGIDAPTGTGPYLPVGSTVTWSYTATNTGNVDLSSVTISDDKITLSCPAVTLAAGASTTCSATGIAAAGQYQNTGTATGTYSGSTVSATYRSHYYGATPAFTITESCKNASAPGEKIVVSAVITNNGNETLAGFSCTDAQGATLEGMPLTILAPNGTASLSGSYTPAASPATDTIRCTASGALSYAIVSAQSSASCNIEPAACIAIKKQVSTNCSITGVKDKHCNTDESKVDYCKRSDCDKSYCGNSSQIKQSYCQEVTQKQAHCGSSETKSSYCYKSGCDRSYCNRGDTSKDDYCKIPALPVCVPVWLDADTQDTAATMNAATGSGSDSDDLLSKLSSTSYSSQSSSWLQKLNQSISNDTNNRCNSADYYQGHVIKSGLMYRLIVSNCGSTDLNNVLIKDSQIGITGYAVAGPLSPNAPVTLTSDQIPQLAQPNFTCSSSFLNTATVSGTDTLGRTASASDDAWVLCNTKTCAFTQGYWKNHPDNWPVSTLKLGSVSYSQYQLVSILGTPPAGNGLISLAQQLIAAKLNSANGTVVPATVQQAINSADTLIGGLSIPPIGTASLSTTTGISTLIQTLDSYNSGTLTGGPTHCGEVQPPQQCTGIIGDFVFNDLSKNGVNNSEPGIAGVKVTLSNGKSTTTDSSGLYRFTGLCAGSYQVKATPPCNFVATTSTSVSINLATGSSSNLSADFGFVKPSLSCTGKIGDFVWNDVNKNGIQDYSEAGLSGVQITLSNGAATVSDASGFYQFTGLCGGDYQVSAVTPVGYTASAVGQGYSTAKDSKGSPAPVTLATNSSSVQNVDFGFYKTAGPACTGVIGNYVWNDLNKNGIQDCSEKGIAGAVLKLSNGQSALTDAEGHYQFAGLCAGSYTITVTTPDGFTPSPNLQGSNRNTDSNSGTATVTLSNSSSSDLSVDFGFWQLPKATGTQAKGCSLGYWKNHSINWPTGYRASDDFDLSFGANAFSPNITLLTALNSGGGGLSNLARQGTAALLNAQDPRVTGFPLSVSEVKAAVMNAILTGNYAPLAATLDGYNNLGCPLN